MSADKDDTLSKVVKLNGLNYNEWRDDTKMILIMKGLLENLECRPPSSIRGG